MKTQRLYGNTFKKYISGILLLALIALSACGGDVFQKLTGGVLVRVEVTPVNETIAAGTSTQFSAMAIYSNTRKEDVTASAQWSSSNEFSATVDGTGLVDGIVAGTATITASYNGVSGSTGITISNSNLVAIGLTPANPVRAKGTSQQFTATGVFSDASTQDLTSQVTWASSVPTISAISSTGIASADNIGTSTITATFGTVSGTTLIIVTDAALVSISLTPPNPSRAMGTTVQFTATGIYSDGTNQNLTAIATWSSSDDATATVSDQSGSKGLATAVDNGLFTDKTAIITASFGTVSGTTNFTVTDATLESITVTPVNTSIPKGNYQQFTAMGIYSDGTSQNITTLATWSSANTGLVSIENTPSTAGRAKAENVGTDVIVTASFDGIDGTTGLTVTSAELVSITVNTTPVTFVTSIAQGRTQEFTATGIYTDGTNLDLIEAVTWSAVNSKVVVSNAAGTRGHGYAANLGAEIIVATLGSIHSPDASTNFTVTNKELLSIGVTPINTTIALGTGQQFTAMGHYTYGADVNITTAVTWGPVTGTVATLSNADGSRGLATSGTTTGNINVTAILDGITGTTLLTVTNPTLNSVVVSTLNSSVASGNTSQFTATGIYSDNSQQVLTESATWTAIAGTGTATVSDTPGTKGLVTATGVGTVTIVATFAGVSSSSAATNFTVTAAVLLSVEVTPANPGKAKGTYQQFTATGIYTDGSHDLTSVATWESLNTANATISSTGYAFAKAVGSSTIRATYGGMSGETTLSVTAATLISISLESDAATMPINRTKQFTAVGTYTDGSTGNITTDVNWTSTNTAAAQISTAAGSKGIVTSIAAGNTSISAVHPDYILIPAGTKSLEVTAAMLTLITITPINPSLANGLTRQFKATGIYDDSTTQDLTNSVTWISSDPAYAAINTSNGLATAVSAGQTTITATLAGYTGPAAGTTLTVTDATLTAISISPGTKSIANGTVQQYTALGIFSDSTTQDMTSTVLWESSATGTATISNAADSKGLATSVATGTTTITASQSTKTDTASLNVTSATLSSISISPSGAVTIGFGTFQQFTAMGTYSDSSTQDITSLVTWSSSNTAIAGISKVSPTNGRATSISAGTSTITAVLSGKTGNASLEVKTLTLVSITVTPSNASFAEKNTRQMVATGLYNDGTTQNLTTQSVWSVGNSGIAVVSNAGGTQGLVTGVSNGTTTASATRDGKTGGADVTITADTVLPTVVSAVLTSATTVKVTYSEPVDVTRATTAANYKIALNSALPAAGCSIDDNAFFGDVTNLVTIFTVAILSPTEFELTISSGLTAATYAVVVSRDAGTGIKDLASIPNTLGCPNLATFAGIDTTKPYLVSISNNTPTQIQVVFSEPMLSDGTANAANNLNNYVLSEVVSGSLTPAINSVTSVTANTFLLTLSGTVSSINYKLQVASNVTDLAVPTPNTMTTPNFLTFTGNEQLKVVSAEAISTTGVKVTFSKPVNSGNNTAGSAGCTGDTECSKRYAFNPSLGTIASAVVGTGDFANTVTITHNTPQTGQSYTVMSANSIDGDGFNNTAWGSIKNDSGTENVQVSPKDRASFVGLGANIQNFEDGAVFTDPFVDNTSFSFAFTYSGRVYLGTNNTNNSAFRFDPNGANSVQTSFGFAGVTGITCPTATGFGFLNGIDLSAACTTPFNSGPTGEVGVVGFNSATVTIPYPGSVNYELLVSGPLKDNLNYVYYTQDVDLQLDWKNVAVTGTNGLNSKSVQTLYGVDNFVFIGISSSHGVNAPVFNRYTASQSSGVVTLGPPYDLAGKNIAVIGGGTSSTITIAGIDSILKFGVTLYIANTRGVVRSNNYSSSPPSWTDSTPSGFADFTLAMPLENSTTGGGLGKIRPGQKGIPQIIEYNGKLYMARNVALNDTNAVGRSTNLRGELWVCTAAVCGTGDWTRIISGSETALGGTSAISLLKNSKSGILYVGFDDPTNGARIYRMNCTIPGASTGSTGTTINAPCNGTGNANWILQGSAGLGSVANKYIFSTASISDGTTSYIYVIIGDGADAVKVFRQIDY